MRYNMRFKRERRTPPKTLLDPWQKIILHAQTPGWLALCAKQFCLRTNAAWRARKRWKREHQKGRKCATSV